MVITIVDTQHHKNIDNTHNPRPGRLRGLHPMPGTGQCALARSAGLDAQGHPERRPHGQILIRPIHPRLLRAGLERETDLRGVRTSPAASPHAHPNQPLSAPWYATGPGSHLRHGRRYRGQRTAPRKRVPRRRP